MEQPAKDKTCDAINGIIDEAKEFMKEFKVLPPSTRA
jgi:ferritin-like metal-binding protein YciE